MAIDFDAIRRKLNKLSGQNSRQNVMWRPQEGEEHTVRLLSFPDNDGQPFKERWFYYNIGNNPGLLAPYQFGNPDPIQELITKLRDDGSKESYELAKKLYPKMRCYAPVVVRGEEEKGVSGNTRMVAAKWLCGFNRFLCASRRAPLRLLDYAKKRRLPSDTTQRGKT